MGQNNFSSRSDSALLQVADLAYTTISDDPIGYGVQAPQLTALNSARTSLSSSITALTAARAAYAAAIQNRDAARQATLESLGNIGSTIYNFTGVTPEMLAAAGYAVHDSVRSPVIPQFVTNVVAIPNANGTALVKWSRSGNAYGVQFRVESRIGAGDWEWIASPTGTRLVVHDVVPGVERFFRVTAFKGDAEAVPSETVVIYSSGEQEALNLAA